MTISPQQTTDPPPVRRDLPRASPDTGRDEQRAPHGPLPLRERLRRRRLMRRLRREQAAEQARATQAAAHEQRLLAAGVLHLR